MDVPLEFWPPPEGLEIVDAFRGFSLLWLQPTAANVPTIATIAEERTVRLIVPQ